MNLDINKIEIRRLTKEDFLVLRELNILFEDVFEMEKSKTPSELYLTKLLEKNDFIVLVAFYEKELIGGLTAYELALCSAEKSEIFIYDIAIKNEFQRKGVGKKLLSFLKDYCKQNDISIFFVEAHEEDVHAVDFYHSTGGNAEKVVHFNYEI